MEKKYVIALDSGTTSNRAIIFDKDENIIAMAQREFTQIYPNAGWVEHNPMEIWATQSSVLTEVIAKANIKYSEIAAIGITNQRETTIVWDKNTGEPIYNAIVWQCRRTAAICDELKAKGQEGSFEEILENVKQRDYIDQHREVSPLRKADDALLLDNSNLSIEQQKEWLSEQFGKVVKE